MKRKATLLEAVKSRVNWRELEVTSRRALRGGQLVKISSRPSALHAGWNLIQIRFKTDRPGKTSPLLHYRDPLHGHGDYVMSWQSGGTAQLIVKLPENIRWVTVELAKSEKLEIAEVRARWLSSAETTARLLLPQCKPILKNGLTKHKAVEIARKLQRLYRGGMPEFKAMLREEALGQYMCGHYSRWVTRHDLLSDDDREAIRRRIAGLPCRPLISVLMPVYNVEEKWLRAAIESVRRQLYPNWELCVADDHSTKPHVRRALEEYKALDSRIRVVFREKNGHISAASNSALELAQGEFVALLDHDDEISEHALYLIAEELNEAPDTKFIYSDEDKLNEEGERVNAYFKPGFDPDLLLGQNYVTHFAVYRRDLLREIGGFRVGFEGSQDYDLVLRAYEKMTPSEIRHIPHILYHWRSIPGSTALAAEEKNYAHSAAHRAIQEHLDRVHPGAVAEENRRSYHRVRFPLPNPAPLVSVIIPTRDRLDLLEPLIDDLLTKTNYPSLEILILDNQSREPATLRYFEKMANEPRVRVVPYDHPFNYSAINNYGASQAKGQILALLNNDLRVISPDWLTEMVGLAARPDTGVVGAKLYYANESIQHAGVILGIGGIAGHLYKREPRSTPGFFGHPYLTRSFSAVTGACMVMRREVYEKAGGLEPELAVAFNDVDFCLRVQEMGYRNVFTPFAELYHLESATRGPDDATPEKKRVFKAAFAYMQKRWKRILTADPYYNPNLTLTRECGSLAYVPRGRRRWLEPLPIPRKPVAMGRPRQTDLSPSDRL